MSFFSKLLFPPKCASCSTLLDFECADDMALCSACKKLWESECHETCGVCAKEVGNCSCLTERMQKAKCKGFYKRVYYVPGKRTQVQNRLIYTVKQTRDQRTVDFFARELLESVQGVIKEEKILAEDVVLTYIPRGNLAKLQYGTDQAKELARALSKLSSLPIHVLIQRKRGRANSQKKLDPVARYKNAKASFAPVSKFEGHLQGKTVFLIDDIVTTGASMAVCTRLLRKMGAREVYAFAIASDILNRDRSVY